MNRDILLVVKSPVIASMLSQHLTGVDVCSIGSSMLGGHYTVIVCCDPLDTPMAESWWASAIRARYPMAAMYFAGHNIGPLTNVPQAQERMGVHPPSPMPIEPIADVEPVPVDVPFVVPETETSAEAQPTEPVDPEPMSPLPPPVTFESTE